MTMCLIPAAVAALLLLFGLIIRFSTKCQCDVCTGRTDEHNSIPEEQARQFFEDRYNW